MKKIVVFIGSPRKNGYSAKLLNKLLEGAKSVGAEIVTYDLNDDKVRGCQGCFYCRSHEGCATQDALQPMYQDIKEADSIVTTFPLYFGNISGQAKIWLDRIYPFLGDGFSARCPGKKIVTIYSQANPDPTFMQDAINSTNNLFKVYGWDLIKSFLIYNTQDPKKTIEESMMQEAYEIGKILTLQ